MSLPYLATGPYDARALRVYKVFNSLNECDVIGFVFNFASNHVSHYATGTTPFSEINRGSKMTTTNHTKGPNVPGILGLTWHSR